MTAMDEWDVDELFATIRRAAPFAELSRAVVRRRARHAVGPLSVRRVRRAAAARHLGPRRRHRRRRAKARSAWRSPTAARFPIAGCSASSSLGAGPGAARVGELDEEMVFESRVGETFVLGASSWRIEEITHDRVLVSPAPGEPGKMPFWKGDRAGRPLELGLAIGRLMHDLLRLPPAAAIDRLTREHDLDRARRREPAAVPARSDGGRRAPCPTRRRSSSSACATSSATGASACCRRAAAAFTRRGRWRRPRRSARRPASTSRRCGETMGSWCGFRTWTSRPIRGCCCPIPDEVQALVVRQLGATALFAAKFRENAARSLLLPKRRPGMRAPLWQQRKRAADLLAVASRYGSFPVLLETYRECLRDFFDMPALVATLADVRSRKIRVATVDSETAVAVCRVAALQLRRELPLRRRRAAGRAPRAGARRRSGAAARAARRRRAARAARRGRRWTRSSGSCSGSIRSTSAKSADGVHDMLLVARRPRRATRFAARIVDAGRRRQRSRTLDRGAARAAASASPASARYIAVEDAARYRDALGVPLPPGIPESLLAAGARSARRSRAALRAHARAVHRRRRSRRATACAPRRRSGPDAADRRRTPRRRRVPPGRHAARVDRRRRAAACCGGARWRSCGTRSSRSTRRCSAGSSRPGRASSSGGTAPTRCSTRSSSCRARRCRRRSSRPRSCRRGSTCYDPADLDAVIAAGEVVWVGVETARRARRPRRAVPRRSSRRGCCPPATAEARPARGDARAGDPRTLAPRTARRSSGRCTRRSAAAIPAKPSTRCGIWSGRASSPTTRSTRCARSPQPAAARKADAPAARRAGVPIAATGAAVRRRPMGAGAEARGASPAGIRQARGHQRRTTRQMGGGHHAAAARAPRRADARSGDARSDRRRIRGWSIRC